LPDDLDDLDLDSLTDDIIEDLDRVKTYIEGFDENLNGGIPAGSIVLVAGSAGTMKSSLTYYILYHNALRKKKKGLYISLEQNRPSLLKHMKNIGWDIGKVEDHLNIWDLGVIRTSLISGETWMNILKKDLAEYKEKIGLDLLVLDSLPVLDIIAKWDDPRTELFQFFEWLRELDITTFLISEMEESGKKYAAHDEGFLSDGIIHLQVYEVNEVTVQRRIRCVKMRQTDHSMNSFSLMIEKGTFQTTKVISKSSLD
jgi:KaiC/GvpD/RAD55 family RecA-like ATPase